ncbi:unnamed protein product [Paramecium sonneborni]|uniref:Uncharacterized protein n=1 Tax=Paramecium sonneborni TaxID=65129 RepID=A0A8S1RQQ3_9CILI|nr:unnamed protein product [Paramecium sonneborni]
MYRSSYMSMLKETLPQMPLQSWSRYQQINNSYRAIPRIGFPKITRLQARPDSRVKQIEDGFQICLIQN